MNNSMDPYSITGYSRLAVRLEHDLTKPDRGSSVLMMAADFERVAVEATTELAWHLAEDLGLRVLLIDGSFNYSGLSRALDNLDSPGILDLLSHATLSKEAISEVIQPTSHDRIIFIPTGQGEQSGAIPANSNKLRELLALANTIADFVLIQGPSVEQATRTLAFGPLVDATLLITLEGQLEVKNLLEAQQILSNSGADKVGLVVGTSRNTQQKS